MNHRYSCIVVDDEPLARQGVKLHIDDTEQLDFKAEFGNAIKAGEYLSDHDVDIIYLDIEMPGLNGLDFLRLIPNKSMVILTTAYPQYALEAFELEVVDYLLKPIKFDRFFKATTKAIDIIKLKATGISELEPNTETDIYIKSDRKYIKLSYADIKYIKGLKDYVIVHTSKGKYITALNVKTILRKLPENQFARVSKSYIININKIISVDIDSISIDNEEIPLGNSYKEAFLKRHINNKLLKR